MPAYPNHQDIRPSYFQSTDPGAVGAGVFWVDNSAGPPWALKVRNASNTGWEIFGGNGGAPIYTVGGVSGDYVVLVTDAYLFVDASGGNLTVTLPDPATVVGQVFNVKKIDNTGFTVTVESAGGALIDGVTPQVISSQYVSLAVISSNSAWWIV